MSPSFFSIIDLDLTRHRKFVKLGDISSILACEIWNRTNRRQYSVEWGSGLKPSVVMFNKLYLPINFYKYLREPFYHITREGKTSFFGFISHWKSCFVLVCQLQENLHRLKFAPKIRYSLFEKSSFEGKTPSMTSTKLNGHFTSFCCLSKWQRYFVFIPSLRSDCK